MCWCVWGWSQQTESWLFRSAARVANLRVFLLHWLQHCSKGLVSYAVTPPPHSQSNQPSWLMYIVMISSVCVFVHLFRSKTQTDQPSPMSVLASITFPSARWSEKWEGGSICRLFADLWSSLGRQTIATTVHRVWFTGMKYPGRQTRIPLPIQWLHLSLDRLHCNHPSLPGGI